MTYRGERKSEREQEKAGKGGGVRGGGMRENEGVRKVMLKTVIHTQGRVRMRGSGKTTRAGQGHRKGGS